MDISTQKQVVHRSTFCPPNLFIEFKKADIDQSLPARFEQQVKKDPDQTAVKIGDSTLTYEALNRIANSVAHTILTYHRQVEKPIAFLIKHRAVQIAAILGILKSGKPYVPLDSSFPCARLNYMMQDSQAGLIITDNENLALAKELTRDKLQLLNIDQIDANFSVENPDIAISPDTIANILYTSGSTGQPKGIIQTHRNLLHKTRSVTNRYLICANDRISLLFSPSFGASMTPMFGALLNGATLFPFNLQDEGPTRLVAWLNQEQITIYLSVPTLFRHIVASLTEEEFPYIRLVVLGGEVVYRSDVELYKKHFSQQCTLLVGFGGTETQVIRSYAIDKETQISENIIPVGYAIEDKEVFILDDTGKEVGFNCIGEIAVRSRYLAPGYWNNPELTRQKFLPDPEGGDKCIYLTGDLGRMRPDGCLEYLGRKDFQVKIRGYRVVLTEIEAALYSLDVVKDAVVVAYEKDSGDKSLVAYVVPSSQHAPTVSALRRALAETLPEYMIPSAFVMLEHLPLTPTGKVDRQALPAPDWTRPVLETAFVAPRNDVERQLAQIWEQVLGIQPIGVQDNFFDLGGNSLVAGRVLVEISNVFDIQLPMIALFEAPTVARLAERIQHKHVSSSFFSLIPIQDQGALPPLFFLYPLGRALRYSVQGTYDLAAHLGDNQPIYGLRYGLAQTRSLDQLPYPPRHIEELAGLYIQEIQQIQPTGPYFLCGRSGGGIIAFEMACQLQRQGQEIGLLVLLDAFHPLRYKYCPRAVTRRLKYYTSTVLTSPYRGLLAQFRSVLYLYLTGTPRKHTRRWLEVAAFGRFAWRLQRLNYYVRHQLRYVPRVYPGKVILFESAVVDGPCEARWGWEPFAAGGLEIIPVPGHHGAMMEEEANLAAMAAQLQACLTQAQESLGVGSV
jgi:amino acid adenylation domain-containing protein